jgi:hypothetical protein
MSILDRAKRAARAAIDTLELEPGQDSPEEALRQSMAELEDKLRNADRSIRQNKDYYEVIASLCEQRDRWKAMFQTQATENAAAQSFMNEQLEKASHLIASLVHLLNTERKASGKPLLELEHRLDTGTVVRKRFEELIADCRAQAPVDIDGKKERDRIADGGDITLPSGKADGDGEHFFPVGEKCRALIPNPRGADACTLPAGHDGDHTTTDHQVAWK